MRRLFENFGLFVALLACLAFGYALGYRSGQERAREEASANAARMEPPAPTRGS